MQTIPFGSGTQFSCFFHTEVDLANKLNFYGTCHGHLNGNTIPLEVNTVEQVSFASELLEWSSCGLHAEMSQSSLRTGPYLIRFMIDIIYDVIVLFPSPVLQQAVDEVSAL